MDNRSYRPDNGGDSYRRHDSSARRYDQDGRQRQSGQRNNAHSYEDVRAQRSARTSSGIRNAEQGGARPRRAANDAQRNYSAAGRRAAGTGQQTRAGSGRAAQPGQRTQSSYDARSRRAGQDGSRAAGQSALRQYDAQPHVTGRNSSLRRTTVSSFGYTEGQGSRPFSYSDRNPVEEGFSLGMEGQKGGYSSWHSHGGSYGAPMKERNSWLPVIVGIIALIIVVAVAGLLFNSCSAARDGQGTQEGGQAMAVADQAQPVSTQITLTFAGDCTLGTDENFSYDGSFTAQYDSVGDPNWFLENVRDVFASDDATIVNMEGTLTNSTTRADKTFAFKAPAEYVNILTGSSVEAASLANNHSHDYGTQSYEDTINTMEASGIPVFGYDRVAYLDVKGVKVGLVGSYFPGDSDANTQQTVDAIHEARAQGAQIVIVYAHWGIELEYVPDSDQVDPARRFVDEGADFVVGSHPHVVQGYETYNGVNIAYSLGNFCFGGSPHPRDPDCYMVQKTFTVTNGQLVRDDNMTIIPCCCSSASGYNNYKPVILTGDRATEVMGKIEESSRQIAASYQ